MLLIFANIGNKVLPEHLQVLQSRKFSLKLV